MDLSVLSEFRPFSFEKTPTTRPRLRLTVWAGTVAGLLAVVHFLEPPNRSLAWISFLDAGHAPIFGAIALAVLQFLLATPLANRNRPFLYGLALSLTVLIGGLSELLQLGSDRSSDPRDVIRDALGACAFLLVAATRDPYALFKSAIGSAARMTCRGVALGLLLLAFAPGARVAHAYWQRAAAFPALSDFGGTWETHFVTANHARFEFSSLPAASGGLISVGHVSFEPARFSAFTILEPYPDWTGYQNLRLVAQSELDRPIDLVLRIHDRWHDGRYADRFNRSLRFAPGLNEFTIPVRDIRMAPENREMDLSAIRRLSLFAVEPCERFSLYLLELGLN